MTMINVSPERGTITRINRIYRRDKDDLYLVLTEEPASRRGQGTLRVGKNMWRYDPGSRKFHHTTLKDTYEESTARNSDFRRQQRSLDYEATSVLLGDLGKQKVFVADLQAVNDEVAFPYIRMWVTRDTQLVLKVEEYSLSKKLLRTSYYTDYLRIGTSMFPTKQIFVDGLVPEKRSQLQLTEISLDPIPDEYFTKDYLERKSR
jgi:outer membrane lipoprotein-sorting protein